MAADQSTTPPPDAGGPVLTRRSLLKTGAGAAAGAAVVSGAEVGPLDLDTVSPTGEAAANPLVVLGGMMAGAWALDEIGILGADDPPDGVSADLLRTDIKHTLAKRKSVNQSTIVDNQNIIQYIPEASLSEAKLAALDAIKSGATKDEAISAGKQAANSHFTTVEKNLLKSWNESVREFENILSKLDNHDSLSHSNIFNWDSIESSGDRFVSGSPSTGTNSTTLRSGESFDIKTIHIGLEVEDDNNEHHNTSGWWGVTNAEKYDLGNPRIPHNEVQYLRYNDWHSIWTSMQSTFDDVIDNITLWLDKTYDGIQTGELSPDEYLSATDMANMIGQNSSRAQAIGNLVALNIPGDYDREATVRLSDGTTMKGFVATTDTTNVSELSAGTQIDPNATDDQGNALYETWYMAFRPETYIEPYDAYDSEYGIQGGEVRFTQDPKTTDEHLDIKSQYDYVIETAAGESATINASEITEETDDSGDTYWAADLSGQLDSLITDVNRIRRVYAGDNPDTYQTKTIDQPFEIVEIEGSGEVEIQQNREPQSDDNYIKPEEWDKMSEQQQEIIDRIEELEEAASGGGINIPGLPSIPTLPGMGIVGSAVVVILGLFGLNAATS
ncbi:hypothetical protein Hrd1104_00065 [Halorhabdus sp. CBA1104]|uniref:hypothetical protein n=1 Tax=Halorhabdus sp. CBA1104 TaxID=1380432 RepID=UPI0012B2E4D7|nr:hypothetical protein [Halorhabdus sp. CBA1104]QGN05840.1 hypothetical protein Hrd1104_00065 [Halorhabdus sp. CBA1104]